MSKLNSKQKSLIKLLEKQFKEANSKASYLQDEIDELNEEVSVLTPEVLEDSETRLPANTLLGEQKNEILKKLRQLPLETLQQLENYHCEGISQHETIID
jgi:hypothetical protein